MRALSLLRFVIGVVVFGVVTSFAAHAAAETELTWYGHAAFKIRTPSGKVLLVDPWLTNPANKTGKEDLAKLDRADLILISHGHSDHVGNAPEIARKTGVRLVSTFDLGKALAAYGGYPKEQIGIDTQGNFGGELSLLDGEVRIAFIPAVHSSSVVGPEGGPDKDIHAGGHPGGFLISIRNGPTIYHTGDTDLFSDMALIPRFRKVDLMLACIGDHFTMGPERAADAVALVQPGRVVPMHFGTFPVLNGTPEAFFEALKKRGAKTTPQAMKIGETLKL